MLKIQEFILAHDNWRELLAAAPYNLKISEEDDFVLFKYNQISSDFNEEICKEARGLILDSQDNFKVVRMAFYKFFNLGECHAAIIDWNSAVATSKEDGSLVSVWFARGQWHISSNGTIDAYKAELSNSTVFPYKNFGQLFEAAAKNCNFNWRNLDPNYIYTFELCSPANKIVLSYPEPKLFHILTRSAATLKEINMDIGVEKPKEYRLSAQKDYENLVASMDDTHEGIVVRDKNCNRVKIKTTTYFTLHHLMNNGVMTLERAIELIWENDDEEFLVYFPELTEYFNNVKLALNSIKNAVRAITSMAEANREVLNINFSEKIAKKEFAKLVAPLPNKHIYFAAYDGTLETKISKLTPSQFIKFFNYYLEDLK